MTVLTQEIAVPGNHDNISLSVKREDLLNPGIPGNKYRKLKYNLEAARNENKDVLLTFGGAFSNHIAAVAYAGAQYGFKAIGIIRGDELRSRWKANPTLSAAHRLGMRFKFVSREEYRLKEDAGFLKDLENEIGDFYLIPEGGTNELAVRGCEEILGKDDANFDLICCCVGTGGTLAGLSRAALPHQEILGIVVHKDTRIQKDILNFAPAGNWQLNKEYHFGGYAKVSLELIDFINAIKRDYGILLDPVYTGKMMYGLFDMIQKGQFKPNTRIMAIHSGGQQGIAGMNNLLNRKNLPLIHQ